MSCGNCTAQRGSVTIFGVGLVVMILVVGGIALDLVRVVEQHRALVEVADAAAAAGSNAIDTDRYRQTGEIVLDPGWAADLAARSVAAQDLPSSFIGARVKTIEPGRITLTVTGRVEFSLLALVAPGGGIDLEVESGAGPHASGG